MRNAEPPNSAPPSDSGKRRWLYPPSLISLAGIWPCIGLYTLTKIPILQSNAMTMYTWVFGPMTLLLLWVTRDVIVAHQELRAKGYKEISRFDTALLLLALGKKFQRIPLQCDFALVPGNYGEGMMALLCFMKRTHEPRHDA